MTNNQLKLRQDMEKALKAGDKAGLLIIRSLLSALHNEQISKKRDYLSKDEELVVFTREARKRKESIEAFEKGERQDLVDSEAAELIYINFYLPLPLDEEQVKTIVATVVEEFRSHGPIGSRDLGLIMKSIMTQIKGRYPGNKVKPLIEDYLIEK